ncbi:hypothetical protein SESBI_02365 [Sesbania bispinosa]|nr:hypothetical protein SESBI_02365 [Sesbania bispinosa]
MALKILPKKPLPNPKQNHPIGIWKKTHSEHMLIYSKQFVTSWYRFFFGRFDMRMMQAAMSRVDDGKQQGDLLYDHFSEKDDFWFDFMANTGDCGNSSYAIAQLLAKPFFRILKDDSELTLLLIGGGGTQFKEGAKTYINSIQKMCRVPYSSLVVVQQVDSRGTVVLDVLGRSMKQQRHFRETHVSRRHRSCDG